MTPRRALLLAALAGAAGGTVAAVAVGDSGGNAPASRHLTIGPPVGASDRLPDGRYDPGRVHLVIDRASVRIDLRLDDPDRGPAWAMRTFTGERRSLRRPATTLAHPTWRQRIRCVQLGRIVNGRFGWIFPDERFRPLTPEAPGQTSICTSARRPQQVLFGASPLIVEPNGATRIERALLWGNVQPGSTRPQVRGLRSAAAAVGPGGALLVLGPAGSTVGRADVTLTGHDGTRRTVTRIIHQPPGLGSVTPGSTQVDARMPDPAGGPPWAVLAGRTADGRGCVVGQGRLVDGHVGTVDASEGLFTDLLQYAAACGQMTPLSRQRPIDVAYGFGGGPGRPDEDLFNRRARVQRRLQPGRSSITIRCSPDVRSVTISTARDTRVLVPSPVGHVVFAVYDGDFASSSFTVTATLRDGTHNRQTFQGAF
ncbi:MAG: hypothetical protein JWO74_2539 [Solirubrobacterales bacterium]|nr:hypothetical protein [Solirubrobacterales bacterium]